MADPQKKPAIASIKLGPDVVVRTGTGVEVYTQRPMADWDVSPHRPTLIRFHGEDFVLADRRTPEDGGVCYVLRRGDSEAAINVIGKTLVYDLDYVRERERNRRDDPLRASSSHALWCLAPLLGLAPSHLQAALHTRFGLHPHAITWASVVAEYGIALVASIVFVLEVLTIGGLTSLGAGWLLPCFGTAGLLLLPDAIVRTSRLLSGALRQYGLYEWLWRRLPIDS
jgi:hypothetical protein